MSSRIRRWLDLVAVIAVLASLLAPAAALARRGPGPGGGGGGGGETTVGNNLSFPIIWSEGVTKVLRGTELMPSLLGQFTVIDGVSWYHQQDPDNTWQAENADGTAAPVNVSWVDWGDNLEAKSWPAGSQVRVETTLLEDLATTMQGYTMRVLSGSGSTEMQGTDGTTYASSQAIIYSGAARLTIQQIASGGTLTWDPGASKWTGDGVVPNPSSADGTYYNMPVFQAGDGPGYYTGEINVGGKIVYGYNWKTTGYAPGVYRLTFSLDGTGFTAATGLPLNTFITDATQLFPSAEGETATNVARIDAPDNLSYIDVTLTNPNGSGGQGSSGGPRHDAQVLSVSAPATFQPGTIVTVSAEVKNSGTHDETFTVTLTEAPDGYTASQSVAVPAGETRTVSFGWPTSTSTSSGEHTFTVTATAPGEAIGSGNTGQARSQAGGPPSTSTCVNPTPVIQGMTAALINPTQPVTGRVDATGCDIGVYFGPGTTGVVRNAEIFGATSFGIYNNGARVNVKNSRIHDIVNAEGDACGGEEITAAAMGDDDECSGGDQGRRYIGGKSGTGILFLGIDGAARGSITGNDISRYGRRGISVSGPDADAQITANTLHGGRPGAGSGGPFQTGIWIANGASAMVTDNTVADHTSPSSEGAAWVGIMVAGGAGHNNMPNYTSGLQINGNRLTNNDVGVLLSNVPVDPNVTTGNHVASNTIAGPAAALAGGAGSDGAPRTAGIKVAGGVGDRIDGNTISGYATPVYVASGCVDVTVH